MNSNEVATFLLGMLISMGLCLWGVSAVQPDISEADLLRFCLDHKIERKDCRTPKPLTLGESE